MEVRDVAKRPATAHQQFLSPQLDSFKENRNKLGNALKARKTLMPASAQPNQSKSRLCESSLVNVGKIRSLSPAAKALADAQRKTENSLSPNQNFYQSKLRSILLRKLNGKPVSQIDPLAASTRETLKHGAAPPAAFKKPPAKHSVKSFDLFACSPKRILTGLNARPDDNSLRPRKTLKTKVNVITRPTEQSQERVTAIFKTGDDDAAPLVETRAKSALAVFRASVELLLKIRQTLVSNGDSSDDIKQFLEQSKEATQVEGLFRSLNSPLAQAVMLLPKYALILVLFTLNFVDIGAHKPGAVQAVEAILELYVLGLSSLRDALIDPASKSAAEEILKHLTTCFENKHSGKEPMKALRGVLRVARNKLVELAFALYRSHDLCVRMESLALEAEKLPLSEAHNRSFALFEAVLRGACGEAPSEPESADPSFSCDAEDPNFIVQPLKMEKYLPARSSPIPPITLVLDLDETLVHFEESPDGGEFLVRPHASEFITQMARYFELVVFTAAVKDYADWILDRIDPHRYITHRLYRHHTQPQNGIYLKDLSRLGRDLSHVVIVDNNAENFALQPENGIYIKTWHDDPGDNALPQLARLLVSIAQQSPADVRTALKELQERQAKKKTVTQN